MKRAGVYTRISSDREGAGLGVDRQEADCRELVSRNGFVVAEVYRDNDLSAYSGKPRPGYQHLIDDVRRGVVDVVVAWHTDRLHRSPVELEEYIGVCDPRGVPTFTVKAGPLDLSTPSGRMVARQLGAVARYEVEHAVERMQRAKLQAATEGRWKGGRRPYGFEGDGVTVRIAEAAEILRASHAVLAGASLRGLAAELNARGVVTSTGKAWRQDTIRSVLLRPRNAGLMEHRGEVLGPAAWPAIVPEDTWRAVVAVLNDPERRTQWASARRWLLSGLALCGVCGGPTYATVMSARNARAVPAYTCKVGRHVARTATEVDDFVTDVVIERLSRPDAVELLHQSSTGPDLTELHTRAVVLRERLDGLAAAYADGDVDARQLREGSERLRGQLNAVHAQIGDAARGSVLSGVVDVADVRQAWKVLTLDRRRAILDALMTITINKASKGRRPGWRPGESYFDPRSVAIEWRTA